MKQIKEMACQFLSQKNNFLLSCVINKVERKSILFFRLSCSTKKKKIKQTLSTLCIPLSDLMQLVLINAWENYACKCILHVCGNEPLGRP